MSAVTLMKMTKFLAFFLAIGAFYVANANPRDIAQDAETQLATLKTLVQGEILAAHNSLSSLSTDFVNFGDNTLEQGKIDIEEEHDKILEEIQQIKDLYNGLGIDIKTCTEYREIFLNYLPAEYLRQTQTCIQAANTQQASIVNSATYTIDVFYTQVTGLEFELSRCNGEEVCITPILTQIGLHMSDIPQSIKNKIVTVTELVDELQITVEKCSETKVAEYTGDANALLEDVQKCVNDMYGIM